MKIERTEVWDADAATRPPKTLDQVINRRLRLMVCHHVPNHRRTQIFSTRMPPGGASFNIGQLLAEDRREIPLATVKPLLLRPLFLNAQTHALSPKVNSKRILMGTSWGRVKCRAVLIYVGFTYCTRLPRW